MEMSVPGYGGAVNLSDIKQKAQVEAGASVRVESTRDQIKLSLVVKGKTEWREGSQVAAAMSQKVQKGAVN